MYETSRAFTFACLFRCFCKAQFTRTHKTSDCINTLCIQRTRGCSGRGAFVNVVVTVFACPPCLTGARAVHRVARHSVVRVARAIRIAPIPVTSSRASCYIRGDNTIYKHLNVKEKKKSDREVEERKEKEIGHERQTIDRLESVNGKQRAIVLELIQFEFEQIKH